MKSTRSVRLITDAIAKRTTTTTTATTKAATAEPLNYYETQCPHAVTQTGNILSNTTATAINQAPEPFTYENVRPYSEVPGPKPLPILGNTWSNTCTQSCNYCSCSCRQKKCNCQHDYDANLHQTMKDYFTIENFGVQVPNTLNRDSKDNELALEQLKRFTRRVPGRFETGLLWRNESARFPDTDTHHSRWMDGRTGSADSRPVYVP